MLKAILLSTLLSFYIVCTQKKTSSSLDQVASDAFISLEKLSRLETCNLNVTEKMLLYCGNSTENEKHKVLVIDSKA